MIQSDDKEKQGGDNKALGPKCVKLVQKYNISQKEWLALHVVDVFSNDELMRIIEVITNLNFYYSHRFIITKHIHNV
jgi:hypothetical protein